MEEIKKKRGRPPKEGSKGRPISARFDEAIAAEMALMAAEKGMTKADIIRNGVKYYLDYCKIDPNFK